MNLEIDITLYFSNEDIDDILSSALEGGIGYWACLDNTTADWKVARTELRKEKPDEIPTYEEVMIRLLENGKSVHLIDTETIDDEEPDIYSFNADDLANGIKMSIENEHWRGDMDEIDSEIGDVIIQYACFGDIIFG